MAFPLCLPTSDPFLMQRELVLEDPSHYTRSLPRLELVVALTLLLCILRFSVAE